MLHVITTPGVAYVTRSESFDLGIMISASHNPYTDNGIKVMSREGEKLSDAEIDALEELMDGGKIPTACGADIGRIVDHFAGRNRYIGYLISVAQHSFRGLRIGLDCANGAAFAIAPSVFRALGAEVHTTADTPSGTNVNLGVGSTHIENLAALVKERGLDMGFAFDGDADRCIAVDGRGEVFDGDAIMYVLARDMMERGELRDNTVVLTVMSNLGTLRALRAAGIRYEVTAVGDRYVYERMKEGGFTLGGEQSGHVIISKYATTGDGILTAIRLTEAVIEGRTGLRELRGEVAVLPQLTLSVRVGDKSVLKRGAVVREAEKIKAELGEAGRLLLRPSGTEPVVRIMIEAESGDICHRLADRLAEKIREEAGGI